MLLFILKLLSILFYSIGQWWAELGAVRDVRVVVSLIKHICSWRWESLRSCYWIIDIAYIRRAHGSVVTCINVIIRLIKLVVCYWNFFFGKSSSLHLRLCSCGSEFRLLWAPLLLLTGGTHRHKIVNSLILLKVVISIVINLLEVLSFPHRFIAI